MLSTNYTAELLGIQGTIVKSTKIIRESTETDIEMKRGSAFVRSVAKKQAASTTTAYR